VHGHIRYGTIVRMGPHDTYRAWFIEWVCRKHSSGAFARLADTHDLLDHLSAATLVSSRPIWLRSPTRPIVPKPLVSLDCVAERVASVRIVPIQAYECVNVPTRDLSL